MQKHSHEVAFLPLVSACQQHGIGKTVAFELVKAGMLDTFQIGKRRYVVLASLHSLPDRLAANKKAL